jgi:hypothetical protein
MRLSVRKIKMAKSRVVCIFLIILLIFIYGCSPSGPENDKAPAFEPPKLKPVYIEPDKASHDEVLTVEPDPKDVEVNPAQPESAWNEATNIKSGSLAHGPSTSFYDRYAEFLKNYVDDNGMIDYKTLRRKRLQLWSILEEFDMLDPNEYKSWSGADKIAFWINVYNLQKLNIVTEHYPIEASRFKIIFYGPSSIRHIESEISRHKFLVMDEEFTFAEIDRRFFRGKFDDPRIFFALTGACMSSPPLRNEPYYGYKLDEQLEDQIRKFLTNPLAFKIDIEKEKVYLSAMFQISSYGREFLKKYAIDRKFKDQTPTTRAVLNFICNYISKQDVSFLEVGNYTVSFMSYDWTINDGS